MIETEILDWLRVQLSKAEKGLRAREHGERIWREGPEEIWRQVGCKMSKAERLRTSQREGRIAVKCRRDVEMFKALISTYERIP